MPRGDRTGPMGAGPMTGRGAGWCAGYDRPGFANPAPWLGLGLGHRGRCGWRNTYYATGLPGWAHAGYGFPPPPPPPAPEQELSALKAQAQWLGDQLARVKERIEEIEGRKS